MRVMEQRGSRRKPFSGFSDNGVRLKADKRLPGALFLQPFSRENGDFEKTRVLVSEELHEEKQEEEDERRDADGS